MTPDRYRIANEASDGHTVTFWRVPMAAPGWTPHIADADQFTTLDHARAVLTAIEACRARAGRRFVVAEIDTPDGPAHREVPPDEADAPTIRDCIDSMAEDANLYFERYPDPEDEF